MPPAAKEMSKAQPMSISQLCRQDDSDDELHNIKQELDRDRLDLNSGEDSDYGSYQDRQNGQDRYSQSSDLDDDEYEDYHRNNGRTNGRNGADEPDYAEQLAAEALGDMANARSGSFMAPAVPFISRMSSLPLVNSALKAYESSKQNNKVMKVSFMNPLDRMLRNSSALEIHLTRPQMIPIVRSRDGRIKCKVFIKAGI